jgi:hypothetical protein
VRDKAVEWLQETVDFFKVHLLITTCIKVERREGG